MTIAGTRQHWFIHSAMKFINHLSHKLVEYIRYTDTTFKSMIKLALVTSPSPVNRWELIPSINVLGGLRCLEKAKQNKKIYVYRYIFINKGIGTNSRILKILKWEFTNLWFCRFYKCLRQAWEEWRWICCASKLWKCGSTRITVWCTQEIWLEGAWFWLNNFGEEWICRNWTGVAFSESSLVSSLEEWKNKITFICFFFSFSVRYAGTFIACFWSGWSDWRSHILKDHGTRQGLHKDCVKHCTHNGLLMGSLDILVYVVNRYMSQSPNDRSAWRVVDHEELWSWLLGHREQDWRECESRDWMLRDEVNQGIDERSNGMWNECREG